MAVPGLEDRSRTGGEWVVLALAAEGVQHVFGIPGIHNLAIYGALLRQAPLTRVLARHERYGAIEYLQQGLFGQAGENALVNPDFPALARAFGAGGLRVADPAALGAALEKALGRTGPTVLELPMAVDPPWEL